MLTKKPDEERPVNIKNFLSISLGSPFMAKTINTIPNKKKMAIGNKKRIEPLKKSLTAGIKNSPNITKKTPINTQNVAGIKNFFII